MVQHYRKRILKHRNRVVGMRLIASLHFVLILSQGTFAANSKNDGVQPTHLTTDLLEHTDRVFLDGYLSNLSLAEAAKAIERYQTPEIRNPQPAFGWEVVSNGNNTLQTAYRILVASSPGLLAKEEADLWDSGETASDNSVYVQYAGKPLQTATIYYWKVKTWDNHGVESIFSAVKSFKTAAALDGETARYPLQVSDETPTKITAGDNGNIFVDFGKDAYGQLKLTLSSENDNDTVTIHLGETVLPSGNVIHRQPGGTIRYAAYRLPLMAGVHTYAVKIRPDGRNTGSAAVLMPDCIGEVLPFRYCEIENYRLPLKTADIVRKTVTYPFDDAAAAFHSSDNVLNQIWDLCRYSMKATSFCGVFVDGDRERIPYEADAFINQLGYYSAVREFSIARYSNEYMLFNTTWPTEWFMHSVLMSWYDYLYTGNPESIKKYYNELKAKTLLELKGENGLISTKTGKQTKEFLQTIHAHREIRDITDWPQSGGFGAKGETDGFVFADYNTVVNAFHYEAILLMSRIAEVMEQPADAAFYAKEAERIKQQINKLLFDAKEGTYRDGVDADHHSLHANMFPSAFGLVPEKHIASVEKFIQSRGMACSVYGSQYLLDAVYNSGDADYGLQLLTDTTDRSWYNMLRVGSTITLEAWDNKYKPNQDWNHAWGAAPANLIPRRLMGIEPLEPGFRKVRIMPQPATLRHADIKQPTIRGTIYAAFDNDPDGKFILEVEIPANMTAEIMLPAPVAKYRLTVDNTLQKGKREGRFVKVETGSGKHRFVIE